MIRHSSVCPICSSWLLQHKSLWNYLKCNSCGFSQNIIKSIGCDMITLEELNQNSYPTTKEIDDNLAILLERLNKIRTIWGNPMIVTSGLRSQILQDQLIAQGKSNAPHSKHLLGQAVDISDPKGALKFWIMNNVKSLEQIGLWMEDFKSTPSWVHFQCVPPQSGKRFFIP